jgi:hypothetical protein
MSTTRTEPPIAAAAETLEERFERLAAAWQNAVAHVSSSSKRDNHPAYREIIALGPAVVPLLLRDLERTNRHWFTALSELTNAQPVPPEDAGNIRKMVEAWLDWGRQQGYRCRLTGGQKSKATAIQR